MNIDSIKNGIVLDHIRAGQSMEIYRILELGELDCTVAIIKNVNSLKMGKKDIIKIDAELDLDLARPRIYRSGDHGQYHKERRDGRKTPSSPAR